MWLTATSNIPFLAFQGGLIVKNEHQKSENMLDRRQ